MMPFITRSPWSARDSTLCGIAGLGGIGSFNKISRIRIGEKLSRSFLLITERQCDVVSSYQRKNCDYTGSASFLRFADMCNSLSEFFSRQLANSKSQETIPVLVPVKLLVAAQIERIAHDKTPNLFVRLAVGNFKTDLQRINAKGRFWRQCKK